MQLPDDVVDQLDLRGFARVPNLLSPQECRAIEELWAEPARFRSEVVMKRHGYGEGVYRYFANPLPPAVARLREQVYPGLAPIANLWNERLGIAERYPPRLPEFLEECAAADQDRPTPLMLRYERGGYNRLHQDRYGDVAFPLQIVILLSAPGQGEDFEGGELLLTEGRPRMQSKGTAVVLEQGEGLIFPNQIRPVESARGHARTHVRHGISEVTDGVRFALGVIFHDAK